MSSILYYSNFCDPSKKLIQMISKSKIKDEIHFVCIDKRVAGNDGATYVVLENNQQMILPPTITRVPALLLLNRGHQVLFGDQIYQHIQPKEVEFNNQATNNNMEPLAFSLTEMGGNSDVYSYLDMTPDDLSAKGDGGSRIMHNYVSINTMDKIETPPEDYVSEKLSSDVVNTNLDEIQQQRNSDLRPHPVKQ